jgi:hypothetical protein
MVEVWYLAITLFVLEPSGEVDGRRLYSVKQDSQLICQQEANARIELFTEYIGKNHIKRFSADETYTIGLSGTLVGFTVGCEPREEPNTSEIYRKKKI